MRSALRHLLYRWLHELTTFGIVAYEFPFHMRDGYYVPDINKKEEKYLETLVAFLDANIVAASLDTRFHQRR
jgi:hypothetical protein